MTLVRVNIIIVFIYLILSASTLSGVISKSVLAPLPISIEKEKLHDTKPIDKTKQNIVQ